MKTPSLLASVLLGACCVLAAANALAEIPKAEPALPMTHEQQQLWDMSSIQGTALDTEVVSSRTTDGLRVEEVYFTSEVGPEGPTRVFCGLAWPEKEGAKFPVLLELHGGGGHGSAERAEFMAGKNDVFAISLDWGGQATQTGDELRTIWRTPGANQETHTGPNSLAHRVVVACRRAIDFAEAHPAADTSKVIVYGGSWGSFYSMLVSGIEPRITDTIALVGAGGWRDSFAICGYGIQLMPVAERATWLRTYDPLAYAPSVNSDVSLVAYTNDSYFNFDGLQENFDALPGPKRLIITPNSDHGIAVHPDAIELSPAALSLLDYHLNGGGFPTVDERSLREDRPGLFQWKTTGDAATTTVLCFSPGDVNWRSRYFIEIPGAARGDHWEAELPEFLKTHRGQFYVTAYGGNGRATSSRAHPRGGADPRYDACPLWPENPLWDQAAGTLAWRQSIYHKTNAIEPAEPGGFRITTAAEDPVFEVLTDSTLLLGRRAREFGGLVIEMDRGGVAGSLEVQLRRDGPRLRLPLEYKAPVEFESGQTRIELPWSAFQAPEGAPADLVPFDSLALVGERDTRTPLTIRSISLMDLSPAGGA